MGDKIKKDPVFSYNVGITVMLMALLWKLKLIKKFPQRDGITEVFISLMLPWRQDRLKGDEELQGTFIPWISFCANCDPLLFFGGWGWG